MSLTTTVTEDSRLTKPCQKFEGHIHRVWDIIHLPGGQQIMTCSKDGSLGVWNLQTGKRIANWQDGESPVNGIALSVDGKNVVSGSNDGVVRLWSIETGKVLAKWTGHTGSIRPVYWDREGKRVLSGSWDGTARVWDGETGKTILEIDTGLNYVYTATFSPDSTLIATGGHSSEDERIKIWDANTGKLIAILNGHRDHVCCLAWTADGRTLISGSHDHTIRTWNTSTWQQLAVFTGHTDSVYGIAISPNGRILASASDDETAQLWNLDNGQPVGSPLQHPDEVNCVSFSTDGILLATGCDDKNAYTWDISAIIKAAGLNELLDVEKSFLHADATRRPVQQPKNVRTIPIDFFTESPSHPDPAITHPISPPSVESVHDDAPLEEVQPPSSPERTQHRFLAWFHRITPARPTFLQRTRLHFFKWPQRRYHEDVELQEHPQSIPVDVPLTQGLPKSPNATGVHRKEGDEAMRDEDDADQDQDQDETGEKEKAKTTIIANSSMNAVPALEDTLQVNRSDAIHRPATLEHPPDEIAGQRRDTANVHLETPRPLSNHAAIKSADIARSRVDGITHISNRTRPSSDTKGKHKQRMMDRSAPKVVDVPLGQATYGDYVASREDAVRPYSLFCCLSWCQKKEKRQPSPPQPYDDDLMNPTTDDPVATIGGFTSQEERFKLSAIANERQPPPEAGPSRLLGNAEL